MPPKTLVLAIVGSGCIVAAGAMGYLAVRSGPADSVAAPSQSELSLQVTAPVEAPSEPEAASKASRVTDPQRRATTDQTAKSTPQTPAPAAQPSAAGDPAVIPTVRPGAMDQAPPAGDDAAVPREVVQEAAVITVEPPRIEFDELTVPADAVIGIRLDSSVSSETARVEDRVTARVARDVTVEGRTAVRAGSKLEGTVTLVERGGKFKDRSRIGVRFTTLVLADNTKVPIQTEAIFRMGEAPGSEATAKIGGAAAVGAIIGAVIGGKKGAAIGTATGAAGGTAAVAAGGRNDAVLPEGTSLTVRLTAPLTVAVEHDAGGAQ